MGPRFCETPVHRPTLKENSKQTDARMQPSWEMAGEFRQDFQNRPLVEAQGHDEPL